LYSALAAQSGRWFQIAKAEFRRVGAFVAISFCFNMVFAMEQQAFKGARM
jgi:hypothetical protein